MGEIKGTKKEFIDLFKKLSHDRNDYQVWIDLIDCIAIAISNSVDKAQFEEREAKYMEAVGRFDNASDLSKALAILIEAFENNPEQDFLGEVYADLGLLSNNKGQFFTPMSVCKMMSETTLEKSAVEQFIANKGYITINDPACGAGATMIAAASSLRDMGINYQMSALFTGNDVDPLVAKMCYVQLSLLGCSGYIAVANTIYDPVSGDPLIPNKTETQEFWYTPMYFSDIWTTRRKLRLIDNFLCPDCSLEQTKT